MFIRQVLIAFLALLACTGCSGEASQGDHADHAGHDDHEEHATKGVVAGTHADWCTEHAVPESACTRCDTSLSAAFKATGDWCGEHGLPESQCLKCNPSLVITRPPKAGG